ncbi:hypothetical protein [Rhodopirellula halodulae]|uniref:hypothetical protein n=1 Tax=Rhodopirellula halodulae TaxID=2894198 RepID=UPI001E35BEF4|nr:hypothetical protein [Rhodopirellula sp. JC737]MCC9658783.1 hypothetical protein [Rhodopirellula sp. JC737]
MELDKDRIRFHGKLMSAAQRFGGSASGDESQPFVDTLYREWLDESLPLSSVGPWLDAKLQNTFESLDSPPHWVEDEPAWPFIDGVPMVFVSQTSFADTPLANDRLSVGETIYLFAGRRSDAGRIRMEYRVISQFAQGG